MAFDAKKVCKKPLVLLTGTEGVYRRAALEEILSAVLEGQDDEEALVFTADEKSPLEWVGSASSVPFLSDRRVVVVRNLSRVDPAKEWTEKPKSKDHPFVKELRALPETALLILVLDDEAGDEDKQRRLTSVGARWIEIVRSAGGEIPETEPKKGDVSAEMQRIAKERGKQMTKATAGLLSEMVGGSATIGMAELEKVLLYVGDSQTVTDRDVLEAVAPEQDYNVYQLVDAIVAGDSGTALKQVRTLVSRNSKIQGQMFSRIFPTIARQFRVIWQARLCLDADCPASDPVPAVLSMLPSKPRINEERDWSRNRAVRAARKISLEQIRAVFDALVEADAKTKGLVPAYSPTETIEEMVLKMASACRSR